MSSVYWEPAEGFKIDSPFMLLYPRQDGWTPAGPARRPCSVQVYDAVSGGCAADSGLNEGRNDGLTFVGADTPSRQRT